MVDRLTWNSILPKAVTGLSSQPLPMTTEKQSTGCTKPLVSILLSGYSYMMSHHSRCKHRPWHVHLLPSAMRTVSVTAWMMANRQLSFSEWWWGFASLHCHWLRDIHQANTSPTYYIRYHMSREHDTAFDNGRPVTASLLTALVMGDLPRLIYPLTFFSLRQVGGREPGMEAARMWHFHWFLMNEDREINQHLYAV